jgi:hexokinase
LIGAIFGTGTNGAYIDRTRTIAKLGEEKIGLAEKGGEEAGQYMVVNTEWGALDNGVCRLHVQELMSRDIAFLSPFLITSWIGRVSTRTCGANPG